MSAVPVGSFGDSHTYSVVYVSLSMILLFLGVFCFILHVTPACGPGQAGRGGSLAAGTGQGGCRMSSICRSVYSLPGANGPLHFVVLPFRPASASLRPRGPSRLITAYYPQSRRGGSKATGIIFNPAILPRLKRDQHRFSAFCHPHKYVRTGCHAARLVVYRCIGLEVAFGNIRELGHL